MTGCGGDDDGTRLPRFGLWAIRNRPL